MKLNLEGYIMNLNPTSGGDAGIKMFTLGVEIGESRILNVKYEI